MRRKINLTKNRLQSRTRSTNRHAFRSTNREASRPTNREAWPTTGITEIIFPPLPPPDPHISMYFFFLYYPISPFFTFSSVKNVNIMNVLPVLPKASFDPLIFLTKAFKKLWSMFRVCSKTRFKSIKQWYIFQIFFGRMKK